MVVHRVPGWPRDLVPRGADGWKRRATGWLLDQCPAEYRAQQVLTRHPVVLARFTAWHVEAQEGALVRGLGEARAVFAGRVPPEVVTQAVSALEAELARVRVLRVSVAAVERALDEDAHSRH